METNKIKKDFNCMEEIISKKIEKNINEDIYDEQTVGKVNIFTIHGFIKME